MLSLRSSRAQELVKRQPVPIGLYLMHQADLARGKFGANLIQREWPGLLAFPRKHEPVGSIHFVDLKKGGSPSRMPGLSALILSRLAVSSSSFEPSTGT